MNAGPTRRLTVVLHDKPQSQRLLDLGARIASQLQAELEGVFVEGAALFRLTGDKPHQRALEDALGADDVHAQLLADYLSRIPKKTAKKLAEKWKKKSDEL